MTGRKPLDQVSMRVHVYLVEGKERQSKITTASETWFRSKVNEYRAIAARCHNQAEGAFEFVDHTNDSSLIPYSRVLFIEVRRL